MFRGRICTRVYGSTIRRTVFGGAPNKDPYKTLGVNRSATDAEVREAYLKKCKELHPDVNPGPKAAMQFMEVREAYNMIGKSESRTAYTASESVRKDTGFEDAMKRAMNDKKDWMPGFGKSDGRNEEEFLHRQQQRQQVFPGQSEMGKKANMSSFEDWEKEHFENLTRRPTDKYGLPKNFKEMTPEDHSNMKKQATFVAAISVVLLLLAFMDVL